MIPVSAPPAQEAPSTPSRPPSRSARPAESLVKVEGRAITLPALPAEARPGRTRFWEVHAQIAATQEDLVQGLRELYALPTANRPLPADLAVPPDAVAEGTALIAVVDDRSFVRLERTYLDLWKGWQAVLVEEGLAVRPPTAAAPSRDAHASLAYTRVKQKVRAALEAPSREIRTVSRLDAGYHKQDDGDAFTLEQLAASPLQPEERAFETAHDKDVVLAQKREVAAHLLLPDLIEAWNPLVARLEEAARQVMDQERPATPEVDAELAALRVHARLAVLERFRKALWYCDLVWCQLASEEPPPPPLRLGGMVPPKP